MRHSGFVRHNFVKWCNLDPSFIVTCAGVRQYDICLLIKVLYEPVDDSREQTGHSVQKVVLEIFCKPSMRMLNPRAGTMGWKQSVVAYNECSFLT